MKRNERGEVEVSGVVVIGLAVLIVGGAYLFGGPVYGVWQQRLSGEAKLARAQQERQILVTQAQAEKDAAQLRSDAIKIVGQAAKDFPQYREQEFMASFGEALREGNVSQIVYVPTEANIPILEARRTAEAK